MKPLGKNLMLSLVAAFLLTACSSHQHLRNNNLFTENYYFNDSLRVHLRFFSDYTFSNSHSWFKSALQWRHLGVFTKVPRTHLFNATTYAEPFFVSDAYLIHQRDSLFYVRQGYRAVSEVKNRLF